MQIRSIHPFPARMAPELALGSLRRLPSNSIVLDPMSGSGTVLRHALALGHHAVGFDMDPLAVLISRVWTTPVDAAAIKQELECLLEQADSIDLRTDKPEWHDQETKAFIEYWFSADQRRELKRLAIPINRRRTSLLSAKSRAALDVLQVALSRIIVTKEQCASLARDTSHSRPHRVALESIFDVREGFVRSVNLLARRLEEEAPTGVSSVGFGDARAISLPDRSVDAIMTSPPYLNAIDYMRGHRLSLVWLGYKTKELRKIRSNSVGAERGGTINGSIDEDIAQAMCSLDDMSHRHQLMIRRYAADLRQMMQQAARVLKPSGTATYVVGNSCLKDFFIRNSNGLTRAAQHAGLELMSSEERALPSGNRYLPMTANGSLSKRMRTETILAFRLNG